MDLILIETAWRVRNDCLLLEWHAGVLGDPCVQWYSDILFKIVDEKTIEHDGNGANQLHQ